MTTCLVFSWVLSALPVQLPMTAFVHSHDLSYHDLLFKQSSVQLVKAVPRRQPRGHKEIIHGLYKLYR